VATSQLGQVGEILGTVGAPGAFTAQRTATADDLDIEVKGVGRLRFPISRAQAQRLCSIARPASYGLGEATLYDGRVRNTWEIPKSRVKIDQRSWRRTLLPVLDAMRSDLGLPDGSKLRAVFHGMLVYAPGQFFLRHKDSEKADGMVGTLVVTLPSSFKGGAMLVEHQGETVVYRASRQPLSFISFYADCYHEVRPVRSGYRIVLTYDLVIERDASTAGITAKPAPTKVAALAALLRRYFETPRPFARHGDMEGVPREPPNRLVYLLDFQYTERGLGWEHLKGPDTARAALLRAAAERAGCEIVLALAKLHEVWDCLDDGWDEPWHSRRRGWSRYEIDEEDPDDESPADDRDGPTLGDLQDSSTELVRWIDASGRKAEPILTIVAPEEVCCTTPSRDLEPYESEYEGYMGNYGNTVDRWYRRGALVVWPRERAFAVRAEASPAWALETLQRHLRGGEVDAARELAASMQSFWTTAAAREEQRGLFDNALRVAEGLDAPALAASLLQPFRVEELTPGRARTFVALARRYGEAWMRSLFREWHGERRWWFQMDEQSRLAWRASLPRLCEALCAADDAVGTLAAQLLVRQRWAELKEEIESWRGLTRPSERGRRLPALAAPILGCLASAAVARTGDLRDAAVRFLCADENGMLLGCLVKVLRLADSTVAPPTWAALGLDDIERHCVRTLEARLGQPAREEDDWSIDPPRGCRCDLCVRLSAFLSDPRETRHEWPLAQQWRRHVHDKVDSHELPVRHETRRSGRPFTLVLEKTRALFEREAAARHSWQVDREWLAKLAGARRS
jgi:2OG-Fe(II) oxygenase superfamily